MREFRLSGKWIAAFVCLMAFVLAMPGAPAYAKSRKRNRVTTHRTTTHRKNASANDQDMLDQAGNVQQAFDEKNLDQLSQLCSYPLVLIDSDGKSTQIKNRKDFKNLDKNKIFAQNVRDEISAVNTAKIKPDQKNELKIGENSCVVMKKKDGKWKVVRISLKTETSERYGYSDRAQAAEEFQKTFYYRDLETLSKGCKYPLTIYMLDGSIKKVENQKELMDLGENKVFTDEMIEAVCQIDVKNLTETNQTVQVGGIQGFYMVKNNDVWMIETIVQ